MPHYGYNLDDLKCCGNCLYDENPKKCPLFKNDFKDPHTSCPDWEWDRLDSFRRGYE